MHGSIERRVCMCGHWMLGFPFAKFKTCKISQQIISTIGLFDAHLLRWPAHMQLAGGASCRHGSPVLIQCKMSGNRLSHFRPFHIPKHHKFNDTYIVRPMIFIALTIHANVPGKEKKRMDFD